MTNRTERVIIPPDIKLKHWGYGEWVEEPDEVTFYYKDVKCDIKRCFDYKNGFSLFGGHLCGYVIVPPNHPWYSKNWEGIDGDVHGGLTYYRQEGSDWVIGFDCAHSRDLVPSVEAFKRQCKDSRLDEIRQTMQELSEKFPISEFLFKVTYRNIAFVEAECKSLVDQMLEVSNCAPRSML